MPIPPIWLWAPPAQPTIAAHRAEDLQTGANLPSQPHFTPLHSCCTPHTSPVQTRARVHTGAHRRTPRTHSCHLSHSPTWPAGCPSVCPHRCPEAPPPTMSVLPCPWSAHALKGLVPISEGTSLFPPSDAPALPATGSPCLPRPRGLRAGCRAQHPNPRPHSGLWSGNQQPQIMRFPRPPWPVRPSLSPHTRRLDTVFHRQHPSVGAPSRDAPPHHDPCSCKECGQHRHRVWVPPPAVEGIAGALRDLWSSPMLTGGTATAHAQQRGVVHP